MTNKAVPITLEQFSDAIQSLPLSALHRTGAELRNSIAHLDYSNEQLKPFAEGTEESLNGQPDEDCCDAIRENEIVISRMTERLARLKQEVEARGSTWLGPLDEKELKHENEKEIKTEASMHKNESYEGQSNAWKDGTFTTGVISGVEMLDPENHQVISIRNQLNVSPEESRETLQAMSNSEEGSDL
ncbi:hypothetical protein K3495_g3928 [Podosphaera aphanis]|nr:hypothetical protein K3495_g3928 [Podosphaera aphanis]